MKYELNDMVQKHNYCIVDEVDSYNDDWITYNFGRLEDKTTLYTTSNNFINHLQKNDYELDEKNKNVILNDEGVTKLKDLQYKKIF